MDFKELVKNPYFIGGAVIVVLLILWVILELTGVIDLVGFM